MSSESTSNSSGKTGDDSARNIPRVLALDMGTSGTRAAVFTAQGGSSDNSSSNFPGNSPGDSSSSHPRAVASAAYGATYGAKGFAELDPEEILRACIQVVTHCLREAGPVDFICPGSFMHSLVLTDENFKPLTPLSIWADRRAAAQCELARPRFVAGNWRERTGCPLSPSYPLYRLLWYREHEPALFDSFSFALSAKSFVLARLLGRPVEDFSSASGSGLFHLRDRTWDSEILDFLRLSSDKLPRLQASSTPIVGVPTPDIAPELLGGAAWLAGGADGPLAHLAGVGRSSDTISLSIGTSMAARLGMPAEDWPTTGDDERRSPDTWCYVLDDETLVRGVARNNGGNVLEWYVRNHYPGGKLEDEGVVGRAEHVPELICVSELHRERAQDENTIGFVMLGARPEHTADEKLRAVVEAMSFQAVEMVEDLAGGENIRRIILSGSLTAAPLIQEILAGLLQRELIRVPGQNASLEGARMLALGENQTEPTIAAAPVKAPEQAADYRAKYEKWKALRRAAAGIVRKA